jgi:hypothetical protein
MTRTRRRSPGGQQQVAQTRRGHGAREEEEQQLLALPMMGRAIPNSSHRQCRVRKREESPFCDTLSISCGGFCSCPNLIPGSLAGECNRVLVSARSSLLTGGDVEGGLAAVIQVILHQAPGHPDVPQDDRKKSGFIVSPPAISFKSNLKVNHVHQGWIMGLLP